MVGGDLHWIWKPYSIYQDIDYVRNLPSLSFTWHVFTYVVSRFMVSKLFRMETVSQMHNVCFSV